jgi:ethanolamine utilization cobalamin adenosyltransferase
MTADQQAFAERLSEAVSRATDLQVRVAGSASSQYTFTVQGERAARALAKRLGAEQLDEPLQTIAIEPDEVDELARRVHQAKRYANSTRRPEAT